MSAMLIYSKSLQFESESPDGPILYHYYRLYEIADLGFILFRHALRRSPHDDGGDSSEECIRWWPGAEFTRNEAIEHAVAEAMMAAQRADEFNAKIAKKRGAA